MIKIIDNFDHKILGTANSYDEYEAVLSCVANPTEDVGVELCGGTSYGEYASWYDRYCIEELGREPDEEIY